MRARAAVNLLTRIRLEDPDLWQRILQFTVSACQRDFDETDWQKALREFDAPPSGKQVLQ